MKSLLGLILGVYIYPYTPVTTPVLDLLAVWHTMSIELGQLARKYNIVSSYALRCHCILSPLFH